MQHISQSSLNTSLSSHLSYTHSFLAFSPSTDGAAIEASAPLLAPLIPTLLDGTYTKLLQYDVTASAFIPKLGHELEDSVSSSEPHSAQDLTLQHPHIKRQMSFLRAYILRIAGNKDWTSDSQLWTYMDHVAVMHTGQPGFKRREKRPELRVEYMHMALLLGFLEDMVVEAVAAMDDVELETKVKVLRGWNKVLWIQNDLFAKYYVKDVRDIGKEGAAAKMGGGGATLVGVTRDVLVAAAGGLAVLFLTKFSK